MRLVAYVQQWLARWRRRERILILRVEVQEETDGRWIADIVDMPGVLTYGRSREDAIAHALALAFRVVADRLEHGEPLTASMAKTPFIPLTIELQPA